MRQIKVHSQITQNSKENRLKKKGSRYPLLRKPSLAHFRVYFLHLIPTQSWPQNLAKIHKCTTYEKKFWPLNKKAQYLCSKKKFISFVYNTLHLSGFQLLENYPHLPHLMTSFWRTPSWAPSQSPRLRTHWGVPSTHQVSVSWKINLGTHDDRLHPNPPGVGLSAESSSVIMSPVVSFGEVS